MSQKSNSNSVYVTIAIGSPDPQAGDTRQIGTILQTIRLVAVKTPTEKPNFRIYQLVLGPCLQREPVAVLDAVKTTIRTISKPPHIASVGSIISLFFCLS